MMTYANGSRPVARKSSKQNDRAETTRRRSDQDAAALASYIADMASELSELADKAHLQMVAYFLNLARVEAEIQARAQGGAPIERGKE
jgi:hypothetical protein